MRVCKGVLHAVAQSRGQHERAGAHARLPRRACSCQDSNCSRAHLHWSLHHHPAPTSGCACASSFCANPPLTRLRGTCTECWRCCLLPESYGAQLCSDRCGEGFMCACMFLCLPARLMQHPEPQAAIPLIAGCFGVGSGRTHCPPHCTRGRRCQCGRAETCYSDGECPRTEFCAVLASRQEVPTCRSCALCMNDTQVRPAPRGRVHTTGPQDRMAKGARAPCALCLRAKTT
jgi:hypothetical protein